MDKESGDICVPREMVALLSDERLILRETGRAVTPFGGVAVFVAYLRQVAFVEKVRQCMPICWRSPANRHALPNFLYKSNLAEVGDEDRYAAERGNRSAGLPQNQPLIR